MEFTLSMISKHFCFWKKPKDILENISGILEKYALWFDSTNIYIFSKKYFPLPRGDYPQDYQMIKALILETAKRTREDT